MKKNAGYSLIELIVAIAIFSIAGIAIVGFMTFGTQNFRRSTGDIGLQYEQQLAVNQVRELLLETNTAINFDTARNALIVYGQPYEKENEDGSKKKQYPVNMVVLDKLEHKLYMESTDFDTVSGNEPDETVSAGGIGESVSENSIKRLLLADNVLDFHIDTTQVKKGSVTYSLSFLQNGKEYNTTETVLLRNDVGESNDVDTIFQKEDKQKDSFVESVIIKRGNLTFLDGDTDVIGKKNNKAVVVKYAAEVKGTEESNRDYHVNWKLGDGTDTNISLGSDGVIEVSPAVLNGETFVLTAYCAEDPKAKASITVTIEDNGVYPTDATVALASIQPGNGYVEYKLDARLFYDNATSASSISLFDWHVVNVETNTEQLPKGCFFSKEKGILKIASQEAIGKTFRIYGIAKQLDSDGMVVRTRDANKPKNSPTDLLIKVENVPEYVEAPKLKIVCGSELNRGGEIFSSAMIINAEHKDYEYIWTVEPYVDDSSAKWEGNNADFNYISLTEKRIGTNSWVVNHTYTTSGYNPKIIVNCKNTLYWNDKYKMKLSVVAKDKRKLSEKEIKEGKKIVDLVADPVFLTVNPVKIVLMQNIVKDESGKDLNVLIEGDGKLDNSENNIYGIMFDKEGSTSCREYSPYRVEGLDLKTNTWIKGWTANYKFFDAAGNETYPSKEAIPGIRDDAWNRTITMNMNRENVQNRLESTNPQPTKMDVSLTLKDGQGNSATSNTFHYVITYKK